MEAFLVTLTVTHAYVQCNVTKLPNTHRQTHTHTKWFIPALRCYINFLRYNWISFFLLYFPFKSASSSWFLRGQEGRRTRGGWERLTQTRSQDLFFIFFHVPHLWTPICSPREYKRDVITTHSCTYSHIHTHTHIPSLLSQYTLTNPRKNHTHHLYILPANVTLSFELLTSDQQHGLSLCPFSSVCVCVYEENVLFIVHESIQHADHVRWQRSAASTILHRLMPKDEFIAAILYFVWLQKVLLLLNFGHIFPLKILSKAPTLNPVLCFQLKFMYRGKARKLLELQSI